MTGTMTLNGNTITLTIGNDTFDLSNAIVTAQGKDWVKWPKNNALNRKWTSLDALREKGTIEYGEKDSDTPKTTNTTRPVEPKWTDFMTEKEATIYAKIKANAMIRMDLEEKRLAAENAQKVYEEALAKANATKALAKANATKANATKAE